MIVIRFSTTPVYTLRYNPERCRFEFLRDGRAVGFYFHSQMLPNACYVECPSLNRHHVVGNAAEAEDWLKEQFNMPSPGLDTGDNP